MILEKSKNLSIFVNYHDTKNLKKVTKAKEGKTWVHIHTHRNTPKYTHRQKQHTSEVHLPS